MTGNLNKSFALRTTFIGLTTLSLLACTDAKRDSIAYGDCLKVVGKLADFEKRASKNIDKNAICSCLENALNTRYSDKERALAYELASDFAVGPQFQPENIDYDSYEHMSVSFIKKSKRDFLSCYQY